MSNFKNIFGNEGWIQSAIDRSRGKTRPGERRRRAASRDASRRRQTLLNDPLFKKYGNPSDLDPNKGNASGKGISGLLAAALKKKQQEQPKQGMI